MSDLLPCPFCEAALVWSDTYGEYHHPVAKCILSGHKFKKGMIMQWNRRALPAAQPDPREAALRDIARQKKTDEMDTEYDVEYAEFEGGYNAIIDVARVALRAVQPAHVNETPKREHDTANVLTPDREAALREALAVVIDELRSGPCALEARRFLQSAVGVEILALLDKPDAHVNETPKSEHDAGNMLTPATKGGHP